MNESTLSNLESLDSAAARPSLRFTSGSSKAFAHWSAARSIWATALDKIARHSGNQRSRSSAASVLPRLNSADFLSTVSKTFSAMLWLARSEEHTSELQSQSNLVCRLLLEKKNKTQE